MKIQKKYIREYKGKKYYKFVIHIPPEILKSSGLRENEDVNVISNKNEIKIKRKSS